MKQLKKYLAEIHPEFNFLTEKRLRKQSAFVEKKNKSFTKQSKFNQF